MNAFNQHPGSRELTQVVVQVVEVGTHQVDSTLVAHGKQHFGHPVFELFAAHVSAHVDVQQVQTEPLLG